MAAEACLSLSRCSRAIPSRVLKSSTSLDYRNRGAVMGCLVTPSEQKDTSFHQFGPHSIGLMLLIGETVPSGMPFLYWENKIRRVHAEAGC